MKPTIFKNVSCQRCCLFLCAHWLLVFTIYGQEAIEDYTFVDFGQEITQKAISTIVQDHNGVIWFGGYGAGMFKNHGVDIKAYRQEYNNTNSLNSSLVQKAFVDERHRLWVGTEVGLNLYDEEYDQFHRVVFFNDKGERLNKVVVRSISDTAQNELLVGTNAQGLFRINTEEFTASPVPLSPEPRQPIQIRSLVNRPDGKLLLGTSAGLYEYDGNVARSVDIRGVATSDGAPFGIESICFDDAGSMWLGTFSNGLLKIEASNLNTYLAKHYKITDERIFTIVQAPDGQILLGTENDGLFALKRDGSVIKNYRYDKFEVNGIKSNSIWSLFVDDQERIWMGYYNAGISVYDKLYDKFKDLESIQNVQNSLQASSATSIIKDNQNRLWIGMDGGGIDVYDLDKKRFFHLLDPDNKIATGLEAPDVQNLFLDSGGNLWVATWNSGVYFLPKDSKKFEHFKITNVNGRMQSYRVMSFAEDKDGLVWIGTSSSGLHYYDTKSGSFGFVHDDFLSCDAEIRKVLINRDNAVWVATNRGLYKRSYKAKGAFTKMQLVSSKTDNYQTEETMIDMIVSLFEDRFGNIWIGSDGAGLWKYDAKTRKVIWYNKNTSNLNQETIASIIEGDNGDIWVGGNNGLSFLDQKNGRFVNYDTNDGLLSNDFNFNSVFKDDDGTLYFGNYAGVNIVDPKKIATNESRSNLLLTDLKIFNKSSRYTDNRSPLKRAIGKAEHITLNHKQSVFSIDFASVNYTRPEKNQYAYYLEGLEETWNFVGSTNTANYTNLSPGEYTFKVKAANNDGLWSEDIKTLAITVLPPWWKTDMALFLYFVCLLLASVFAYRLVKERVREKRMIQVERAKRLQEEELNNKKIQFFTNISHEFRTPLTLIMNPLESVLNDKSLDISKGLMQKLLTVRKNTSRLKRLIDELMDFRKLQLNKFSIKVSAIEAISYSKEIVNHFKEEAALKNIALLFETESTELELWSDPSMLEKVLFNILSNAFKITPDNGTITVGIHKTEQPMTFPLTGIEKKLPAIEIFIEDTGSGISQEEVKRVFERFYQVKNLNSQYYGGTGIGLEVVKNFVDLLKGEILVESEEAVGTKFRIFLPMGKEHFEGSEFYKNRDLQATSLTLSDLPSEAVDQLKDAKAKQTLLLVEDNTELRNFLKQELKSRYRILEASNGKEALLLADKYRPDLVVTDVVMPEMDGFDLCHGLRENLTTSHIPILMLTAKSMNEDWIKGIGSGADVYLNKPFDINVLVAQLGRMMKARQVLVEKLGNDSNSVKIPENTSTLDKNFISRVVEYIVANMSDENLNVEQLAEELNLSRSQLYRKVKALTGFTANEFLRKLRLERAKEMIENGDASISEVCFKVGFSSPSYFTKCFKAQFGILPTELKQE